MARATKRIVTIVTCTILAALAVVAFSASPLRVALYKLPIGGTFDKYTRLSQLLQLSMSPTEVQAVLGAPVIVATFTNGVRWEYDEVAQTTGWRYVAEFEGSESSRKLVYLSNVEHVVFPKSRRWEKGQRVEAPQSP